MSRGEELVRVKFNMAEGEARSVVNDIKTKTAELIDLCDSIKDKDGRLTALAITAYEEAAMWAVKAATT